MTYQYITISRNKSLSTHNRKCCILAMVIWLARDNQQNIIILTAGQHPKGLRADVHDPPGVKTVRPHVPLCEKNPIIAAQQHLDSFIM